MKSAEDFYAFFQSTLMPIVDALEEERKQLVKKIYTAATIAIIFIIIYSIITSFLSSLIYAAIGGAIGYFIWYQPKWQEFRSRFKTEVIGPILKFCNENLEYNHTEGISRAEFLKSSIFDTGGDRFLSEDLVTGKIGSTTIRFSEVHTQQKHEIKANKGTSGLKRWTTLFKGVVFIADFNKHFNGRTVVLTDQAEKKLGSIGSFFQKMNSSRDPLVKMENIEFEKAFVVYSSDSTEAHYILTPSLMERILSLRLRFSGLQLAFYNSIVFISIPFKENLFEAKPFETLSGHSAIEKYYSQLKMFIGIVEELNLNTRIWTKE